MSHLLDRLNFFQSKELEQFSDGWGQTTRENRDWEDTYRNRWRHDKIVRSTHGVNCTGSCSWKIYVKSGIVTWETQQTDYPRTRAGLPNHEPRGCARGASYSWYLYSANRVKNPLIRGRADAGLAQDARHDDAGRRVGRDPGRSRAARQPIPRRAARVVSCAPSWDEATEIIAAANAYTAKTYGPDRVFGFSPIPAMSMVSYAAGSRYLSPAGRHLHVVLRLVLRPAACVAPDLGRTDRRAGKCRLVQRGLPDALGVERAADPDAGRAFLYRGRAIAAPNPPWSAPTIPRPPSSATSG